MEETLLTAGRKMMTLHKHLYQGTADKALLHTVGVAEVEGMDTLGSPLLAHLDVAEGVGVELDQLTIPHTQKIT